MSKYKVFPCFFPIVTNQTVWKGEHYGYLTISNLRQRLSCRSSELKLHPLILPRWAWVLTFCLLGRIKTGTPFNYMFFDDGRLETLSLEMPAKINL